MHQRPSEAGHHELRELFRDSSRAAPKSWSTITAPVTVSLEGAQNFTKAKRADVQQKSQLNIEIL